MSLKVGPKVFKMVKTTLTYKSSDRFSSLPQPPRPQFVRAAHLSLYKREQHNQNHRVVAVVKIKSKLFI